MLTIITGPYRHIKWQELVIGLKEANPARKTLFVPNLAGNWEEIDAFFSCFEEDATLDTVVTTDCAVVLDRSMLDDVYLANYYATKPIRASLLPDVKAGYDVGIQHVSEVLHTRGYW